MRVAAVVIGFLAAAACFAGEPLRIQLDVVSKGYDGKTCWVHPRAGAIPDSPATIVMTMQKLLLTGSDVFFAINDMRSDDGGRSWSGPVAHDHTLGRRKEPDGVTLATSDFWPKWHAASGKLLGTGHTVRYRDGKVIPRAERQTVYSVYDPAARTWTAARTLRMPDEPRFRAAGAGCTQRVDLDNGDILLPIYHSKLDDPYAGVSLLRCRFDGSTLAVKEIGNELRMETKRGFAEPSLARFRGRFYLTLRHDDAAYVSQSKDGIHFDTPREWRFDDGIDLGSYNTQAHWVTSERGLYLVYTRRGANNDHVFRHRAPLFIAHVDPERMRVIRATERILVPERGARLGNFGVTEVSPRETWVTVAEWMQTWGPNFIMKPDNRWGADNSVYAARIFWE